GCHFLRERLVGDLGVLEQHLQQVRREVKGDGPHGGFLVWHRGVLSLFLIVLSVYASLFALAFALSFGREALFAPKAVLGFPSERVATTCSLGGGVVPGAGFAWFRWHGVLLALRTVFDGGRSYQGVALGAAHGQDALGIPHVHIGGRMTTRVKIQRRFIPVQTQGIGGLHVVKVRTVQESGHHSLLVAFITLQPI